MVSIFDINFDDDYKNNKNVKYFHTDITSEKSIQESLKQSIKFMDSLEILVNNAGIGKAGNVLTTTKTDWDNIMKVNLTGTYLMTKNSMQYLINSKNL